MKRVFYKTAALDASAVRNGLGELVLQENAAEAVARAVRAALAGGAEAVAGRGANHKARVVALCGRGNNGADAAAAARKLSGEFECAIILALGRLGANCAAQVQTARNFGVRVIVADLDAAGFAAGLGGDLRGDLRENFGAGGEPNSNLGGSGADFGAKFNGENWSAGGVCWQIARLLRGADCVIDGLFGSGLAGDLSAGANALLRVANECGAAKIAVDVPSGLDADGNGRGEVFRADVTVAMGALKLCLFSDFAKDFVGRVEVAALGVCEEVFADARFFNGGENIGENGDKNADKNVGENGTDFAPNATANSNLAANSSTNLNQNQTPNSNFAKTTHDNPAPKSTPHAPPECDFLATFDDLDLPARRTQNVHKGSFGHAFVAGGEMHGAANLCALAALRAGAGRASVVGAASQSACVMQKAGFAGADAVAVGCGLGAAAVDVAAFADLPVVVDADGLLRGWTAEFYDKKNAVLTPHPKEFAAMLAREAWLADVGVDFEAGGGTGAGEDFGGAAGAASTAGAAGTENGANSNLTGAGAENGANSNLTGADAENGVDFGENFNAGNANFNANFSANVGKNSNKNAAANAHKHISVAAIQRARFALAREFSRRHAATLVLKGANTIVAQGGRLWLVAAGSARLSKGGSGDVLAGAILGLLAQGYDARCAALQGVLACAKAASLWGGADRAMLPSDLIELLGRV